MFNRVLFFKSQTTKLILAVRIINFEVVLQFARMAELVDALDLGSSGHLPVGVQVPLLVQVYFY